MRPETHTHAHKRSMWAASPALWNILHPTCLYNSLSTSSSWSLITLSLYPPLGRKNTPSLLSLSSLSLSLSLSLKSARQAPSAIEHDFVTLGASKEHIAAMRSGCSKSHLYWRFYVGKNWIINLRHLWQHGSSNVKSCYHPALRIFTEGEDSIRGKRMKNCVPALYCCRFEITKLLRQNAELLWRE